MNKIDRFLDDWRGSLMSVSRDRLQNAINASNEEDWDNKDYAYCTGMLVEPNEFDEDLDQMPDELFKDIENEDVKEYAIHYALFENNPNSDLWIKVAEIVDENGY